jgi:parallel beta-helix repeat protein
VCGSTALSGGPATAPPRAVTVPAGDDGNLTLGTPGTTYWFTAGTHTLGSQEFTQIIAGAGDTYIGAPGAVLSGQGKDNSAFTGKSANVTIEYLTIKDFGSSANDYNQNQGVVNHTSATGWVVAHDTIESNQGAGVMLGSNDILTENCLTKNGQYGFSSYSTTGVVSNLTVTDNDVSFNDTYNWTAKTTGCGCSGGAKFWDTDGAVVTGNYVHTNENVGLWVDTDNRGFDISGNYISGNYAEGIIYEISYNALVSNNTFVDNGWGGASTSAFDPAIYISESGGDSRVPSAYAGELDITDNDFINNWDGVILYENSNRFCGDGYDSTCTLVDPTVYTVTTCSQHHKGSTPARTPDYYDNCRWKTQTVTVSHNTFAYTPTVLGSRCTKARNCGYNGLFSEYGTTTPWTAWSVPLHISDHQNDHFTDNTYTGPWRFDGFTQGQTVTWAQWTAGFTDSTGSGDHFDAQDAGSTLHKTPAAHR